MDHAVAVTLEDRADRAVRLRFQTALGHVWAAGIGRERQCAVIVIVVQIVGLHGLAE